ncbi:myb-related protein 1, partial [Striga asiatica]
MTSSRPTNATMLATRDVLVLAHTNNRTIDDAPDIHIFLTHPQQDVPEAYENFQKIIEDTIDILRDSRCPLRRERLHFLLGSNAAHSLLVLSQSITQSVDEEMMIKRL